jgi:hypothetical protein
MQELEGIESRDNRPLKETLTLILASFLGKGLHEACSELFWEETPSM